jgi:hypothetical protein
MSCDPLREHKREIDENQSQLVGQVVDAVHDEAQAVGLIPGDCLNNKDCAVDCDGGGNRFLVVRHDQNFPQVVTVTYIIKARNGGQ